MKTRYKMYLIFVLLAAILLSNTLFARVPQLSGLPNVAVVKNGDSWTLKMAGGQLFIFTPDKLQQLQVYLNPLGQEITPAELTALQTLSISQGSSIPSEFLLVPYTKGNRARLYQCYVSFSNNRISCSIILLTPVPIPNSPQLQPSPTPAPHAKLVPLTPVPNSYY